jgi:hypothetical protein
LIKKRKTKLYLKMCKNSTGKDQRSEVLTAINGIQDRLVGVTEYPYPVLYRSVNTNCGHQHGSCNVDKEYFVRYILKSIEKSQWEMTKKLWNMWEKMLSADDEAAVSEN